jgi:hypothetical protein
MLFMDRTAAKLSVGRRFAQVMDPDVGRVDAALPALRAMLDEAHASYKLIGGVAVVHHGYVRTTIDLDVLVDEDALVRVEPLLDAHGFVRETRTRLRHVASNVAVDLLIGGESMARPGQPAYPSPDAVGASPADPHVIDLPGLVELKLRARRYQNRADIVMLLGPLDEGEYLAVESAIDPELRAELLTLRRDALEEREWDGK